MNTLSRTEIEQVIRELLHKYHAEYAPAVRLLRPGEKPLPLLISM